jgi:hypothetical protein
LHHMHSTHLPTEPRSLCRWFVGPACKRRRDKWVVNNTRCSSIATCVLRLRASRTPQKFKLTTAVIIIVIIAIVKICRVVIVVALPAVVGVDIGIVVIVAVIVVVAVADVPTRAGVPANTTTVTVVAVVRVCT